MNELQQLLSYLREIEALPVADEWDRGYRSGVRMCISQLDNVAACLGAGANE